MRCITQRQWEERKIEKDLLCKDTADWLVNYLRSFLIDPQKLDGLKSGSSYSVVMSGLKKPLNLLERFEHAFPRGKG